MMLVWNVILSFDVTIGFPNFEKVGVEVESEYDIRKISESDWSRSWIYRSRSGVGVRNKRLRPSQIYKYLVLQYETNPGCWVNKLRICVVRVQRRNFAVRCTNTVQYANNYFSVRIISTVV